MDKDTVKKNLANRLINFAAIASQCAAYSWDSDFIKSELDKEWRGVPRHGNRVFIKLEIDDLRLLTKDELYAFGFGNWSDDLVLIPLWARHVIANGEIVYDIFGEEYILGVDKIDLDVRFGCLAYGFKYE